MAERKSYRNTRTDAVRLSSTPLGYPYVESKPSKTTESKTTSTDKGADKSASGDK